MGKGRAAVFLWLGDSFAWALRMAEFFLLNADKNTARERAEPLLGIQLPTEPASERFRPPAALPDSFLLSFLILPPSLFPSTVL